MGRQLVVCFDGTNNEFGPENTNVVRLVQALERDPSTQRLYYDPGVGTFPEPGWVTWLGKKASEWLGLAFGAGLSWKLQEAYCYLMEMWEPGDRVFLFGFSRGAYSARVLAGMLHTIGLLPRGNDNLVPYAMRIYADARTRRKAEHSDWRTLCDNFRWTFSRPAYKGDSERHFPVHFLGVWDTVSSVGWVWDPDKYPYTACNPSIAHVRHAISIDERRWFFRQNLMHTAPPPATGAGPPQDLEERWFAGVHSDVGGGYPESLDKNISSPHAGLWRLPFEWILTEAMKVGLAVDGARREKVVTHTPPLNDWRPEAQHESLTPGWWPAEFFPKQVWQPSQRRSVWDIGRGRHRTVPEGALIDASALGRIRDPRSRYSPPNLSPAFLRKVRELPEVPSAFPYSPT
jgi:uncharacterized protein (DUF2235 family)